MNIFSLRRVACALGVFSFAIGGASLPAFAQTAPNAGTLLRDYEKVAPVAPPPSTEKPQSGMLSDKSGQTGSKVLVKSFAIEAKQFPEADLQAVIADFIGKELTLADLQKAARAISTYYLDHGFMARAYLPPQTINNGIVKIIVQEGKLGKIKVDPSSQSRFDNSTAQAFVENRVPEGDVLRTDDLHEGLAVLNEEPGVVAVATLQPGAADGETDAVVKLSDGPLLNGSFQIDNQGIRSVGSTRGIASGFLNDALGLGDQFSAVVLKSSGSDYARLGMTLPAGVSGLRYGVNASMMHYGVDHDFSNADQEGYAYTMGGTLSYPVMRHSDASISTDLAFDHKRLVNSAESLNTSDKQANVANMHGNAVLADDLWSGAVTTFDDSITLGGLDLSGDQGNLAQDQASLRSNGFYSRFNASISRLQNLDEINQLFVSFSGQAAPDNLDSSEQMSLGGPDGVRAYPTDEALGDLGFLGRIEGRHNVLQTVQLFDFYDAGWIQQHTHTWAGWSNGAPNAYWLQDIGFGVNWRPADDAKLGVTVAHTLGNNPGAINARNSDGYNNHLRLLLQASYSF